MKAIRVSVSFHEWSKVEGFLGLFMEDEDTFIYLVDNVTFIAVFAGECAMAYFKAALAEAFDEEPIIVELKAYNNMKTSEHNNSINYEELKQIMGKVIEHCQIAKAECLKDNPDIVVLCDNAIEEIGNLLAKAEYCIYTFNF